MPSRSSLPGLGVVPAGIARRSRTEPASRAGSAESYREILDAAERLFAGGGFAATSMRAITEGAGVGQSLLHYHFGTKEKLFQAMFGRRSEEMNDLRLSQLSRLFVSGTPALEDLLKILLRPAIELGRDADGGTTHFSRLVVMTTLSSEAFNKELIEQHFDPFARHYVVALRRVLPQLPASNAIWGYLFALGVAMTVIAPTGRANRLSDGACDDADTEILLDRVIEFAAAGLRRLAGTGKRKSTATGRRRPSKSA